MIKVRLGIFALFIGLIGCNTDDDVTVETGDWIKMSSLEGVARHAAVGFSINNEGYLGLGADYDNTKLTDFWKYDPIKNSWSQIADFPDDARTGAVGLSIENNGYVGLGLDVYEDRLSDFWKYDPAANEWTQISDFGGSARRNATSFTIGSTGYVGTGFDGNYLKDFYSYNPSTDVWSKISSFGGDKRLGAASFVIGDLAYVGTGNNNGSDLSDFYVYDASTDIWTEKRDFTDFSGMTRSYGGGFSIGSEGFFWGGSTNSTVWKYIPANDTGDEDNDEDVWAAQTSFEGTSRNYAVTWVLNDEAYVATGSSGTARFDDIWKFTPNVEQED